MAILTTRPRGTNDFLPAETPRWQYVERTLLSTAALYGYGEIRTPTFEHTELFQRGVGDTTDVVNKEMYTFTDKGDRSITLRPEGTAGICRAAIENGLLGDALPLKVSYVFNCFRYEKAQRGRFRQFHQFGVECYGAIQPVTDAEVISLAWEGMQTLGLKDLTLAINSIGCPTCRQAYLEKLKEYLQPKLSGLCKTCQERFSRNPLRILDCKEDGEKLTDAPSMLENLCDECAGHFEKLKQYLEAAGISYEIDSRIVRGLDYYTKTVFEIITETENGPLTVCGGGRYDGLVEELGGPATPGIGFGMGVERMIMVQDAQNAAPKAPALYDAFVVTMGDEARLEGMKLVRELRAAGIRSDLDHAARSMKAQFKYADKVGAARVLVLAGDEMSQGMVKVRDMNGGAEQLVPRDQVVSFVKG